MQGIYELNRDKSNNLYCYYGVENCCMPHFHKQVEVLYINSGSCSVRINDDARVLHTNEIALSDSFDIHSYKPLENYSSTVMIFPFYLLKNYFAYKQDKTLATNFIAKNADCKRILFLINQLKNATNPLLLSGLSDTLLFMLTSKTGLSDKTSLNADIVRDILVYIEENYFKDITLTNISKHFSYSPTHFSHIFNSYYGVGLNDYVNSVRINKLLELKGNNPSASTIDLAFEVGFNSLPTFYRAFTKQTGTTPYKY